MSNTLFAVIGGIVIGVIIVATVYLQYASSLTVPPRDLRRRWRSGR